MQTKTLNTTPAVNENGIASRLFGLLNGFLAESDLIPGMYRPIILNFVKPYLQKTSESELREQIEKIRDQIIPFLLTGK